jgi:hypothetical protein
LYSDRSLFKITSELGKYPEKYSISARSLRVYAVDRLRRLRRSSRARNPPVEPDYGAHVEHWQVRVTMKKNGIFRDLFADFSCFLFFCFVSLLPTVRISDAPKSAGFMAIGAVDFLELIVTYPNQKDAPELIVRSA